MNINKKKVCTTKDFDVNSDELLNHASLNHRRDSKGATAGKAPKAWVLPKFWVLICSYKKQPVKKMG